MTIKIKIKKKKKKKTNSYCCRSNDMNNRTMFKPTPAGFEPALPKEIDF